MHPFKISLIQHCRQYLKDKIQSLEAVMKDITEAADGETKSTAGDKHETSRAMMQLEQEKLGKQLKEAELQLADFDKIDFSKSSVTIGKGSFIETGKGLFFMAVSIGKLEVDDKTVFVISPQSPLAVALTGAKEKETIVFNGVSYTVKSVI